MKKLIASISLILCTMVVVNAQESTIATIDPNAPEMTFEKEVHDYGKVKFAGDGSYDFKFKNTGKQPLIISNARGSCGCTVPSWPKEPIKPGETGVIKVTYDTKRVGPISKSVTITSNAKTETKVLQIKGTVEPAPAEAETMPVKKVTEGATPVEK